MVAIVAQQAADRSHHARHSHRRRRGRGHDRHRDRRARKNQRSDRGARLEFDGRLSAGQPSVGRARRARSAARLTEADAKALVRGSTSIAQAAPYLRSDRPTRLRRPERQHAGLRHDQGVLHGAKWPVHSGEMWSEAAELSGERVCVVGTTVAESLFGPLDPVGRTVRIGRHPFRILGVLVRKGESPFGTNQDDVVMMPTLERALAPRVDAAQQRARHHAVRESPETNEHAKAQAEAILRERHHIAEGQGAGFRDSHASRIPGLARCHLRRVVDAPAFGRRRIAVRRRDRNHEHHARVGRRADARNRHSHGGRGAREQHLDGDSRSKRYCWRSWGGVGVVLRAPSSSSGGSPNGPCGSSRALRHSRATSSVIGVAFGFLPAAAPRGSTRSSPSGATSFGLHRERGRHAAKPPRGCCGWLLLEYSDRRPGRFSQEGGKVGKDFLGRQKSSISSDLPAFPPSCSPF